MLIISALAVAIQIVAPHGMTIRVEDFPGGEIGLTATAATCRETLEQMAVHLGFDADWRSTDAPVCPGAELSGPPLDVVRWLLRDYDFVVVSDPMNPVSIEQVIVLAGPDPATAALLVSSDDLSAIAEILQETPRSSRGLRAWLEQEELRFSGEDIPPPAVLIGGEPANLNERMTNRVDVLEGDYETYRLSPGPDGYGPRHLHGANDAAQLSLEEALARTTRSAVNGVRDLSSSLEAACLDENCDTADEPDE
ncbi:hypothetical protein [Hyphobacterium sp.]|uniref:hypothetical protein n=1 Tax=Hyphobacterium sp. TaxID=2004662 RepID=UPI00374A48BC